MSGWSDPTGTTPVVSRVSNRRSRASDAPLSSRYCRSDASDHTGVEGDDDRPAADDVVDVLLARSACPPDASAGAPFGCGGGERFGCGGDALLDVPAAIAAPPAASAPPMTRPCENAVGE
jgi:hypothetical protein